MGAGARVTLTPDDAEAIRRECPEVRWAAPCVDVFMQVIAGGRNWFPRNILGTVPEYLHVRDWSLEEGAMFTDEDVQHAAIANLEVNEPLFHDNGAWAKALLKEPHQLVL